MNSLTHSPAIARDLARAAHTDRVDARAAQHARAAVTPRPPRRRLRLRRPLPWRGRVAPA